MQGNEIPFFYIDEYYMAGNVELKTEIVLQEVVRELEEGFLSKINLLSVINRALVKLDLRMTEAEVTQFFDRYISDMGIAFAKNGSAFLQNKPTLNS